jgi:ABC-type uncharacterized transport system auxiliary subunit
MRKDIGLVLIMLALTLSGCVAALKQPSPQIHYYTLEYGVQPPDESWPPLPAILRVERFSAAPAYMSNKIIYREQEFTRSAYVYHRWRASPADLATYFLVRDLQAGNLFAAVFPPGRGEPQTHVLQGVVDEFLEWDRNAGWEAHLALNITLLAAAEPDISQRVLFQKQFIASRPCAQKDPQGLARAMSEAMAQVSLDIRTAVYNALQE